MAKEVDAAGKLPWPEAWSPPTEVIAVVDRVHRMDRLAQKLDEENSSWYGGIWHSLGPIDNKLNLGVVGIEDGDVIDAVAANLAAFGLTLEDYHLVAATFSLPELDEALSWLRSRYRSRENLDAPYKISAQWDVPKNRVYFTAGDPAGRTPWQQQVVDEAVELFGDRIIIAREWAAEMEW